MVVHRSSEPLPPVFDPEQLTMVAGDEVEEARELIELFATSGGDNLSSMDQGLQAKDVQGFLRAAHAFKGSAGMIGAFRLHHCLAGLMDQEQLEVLQRGAAAAQQEFAAAQKAMSEWLAAVEQT